MSILVDTSVWVEYFQNGKRCGKLDFFIDENVVITNDLILAELIPFLKIRKQKKIIELLGAVQKLELFVDWEQLVEHQYTCLKEGINGIGIPDLIIAQNAQQNHCEIYSLDNHFQLMKDVLGIKLISPAPNF
ncbi:MAG: PIN domain-containing protein [Desulfobulbaceae bacterium]|nr:PIN domain-containing protein [Desulfobulbaceae bacterium]